MHINFKVVLTGLMLAFCCFGQSLESLAQRPQANRRVINLQISASARGPVGVQQKWMQMLQDVGADRISSKTSDAKSATVEEFETSGSTLVTVTGYVEGNKLKLPGGSFTIRDKAGIRALLQRIRDDGAKVALAEKTAFGLTAGQLVGLYDQLTQKVDFQTNGQKAGDVFQKLSRQTGLSFKLDRVATAAINGSETVPLELKGMSIGTALAIVVQPLGLVIEPKRPQGKQLEMHVIEAAASKEHWPIGWPPETSPGAAAPKLFERLPIDIRNYPMNQALAAVEQRAGVPFVYDTIAIAEQGIDLAKTKVTLVQKKVALLVVVSKLLRQSKPKLHEEVRLDENGAPFLWISPQ